MKYSIDGNKVCCTNNHFRNIVIDEAGFGDSLKEAFLDLINKPGYTVNKLILKSWEEKWLNEKKDKMYKIARTDLYTISINDSIKDIEEKISLLMDKGYTPAGGICIDSDNDGSGQFFYQAMMKNV